jgi:hypothetical protein
LTRFKDLDPDQRGAFKELLLRAVDRRVKEDMDYTSQAYRLLALGNGAGIALLASFMGVVAGRGNPLDALVSPLWKFLLGVLLAALINVPLMAVAAEAVNRQVNQTVEFFQNKADLESIQGWGLSKRGRILVALLALSSLACFIWGVAQCIWLLNSVKP